MGTLVMLMDTINVFEWFLEKNRDNRIVAPVFENTLEISMLFSFTDYSALALGDYRLIEEDEIRFEAVNIRKLEDKHVVQVCVYLNNDLVLFKNPYKYKFI